MNAATLRLAVVADECDAGAAPRDARDAVERDRGLGAVVADHGDRVVGDELVLEPEPLAADPPQGERDHSGEAEPRARDGVLHPEREHAEHHRGRDGEREHRRATTMAEGDGHG